MKSGELAENSKNAEEGSLQESVGLILTASSAAKLLSTIDDVTDRRLWGRISKLLDIDALGNALAVLSHGVVDKQEQRILLICLAELSVLLKRKDNFWQALAAKILPERPAKLSSIEVADRRRRIAEFIREFAPPWGPEYLCMAALEEAQSNVRRILSDLWAGSGESPSVAIKCFPNCAGILLSDSSLAYSKRIERLAMMFMALGTRAAIDPTKVDDRCFPAFLEASRAVFGMIDRNSNADLIDDLLDQWLKSIYPFFRHSLSTSFSAEAYGEIITLGRSFGLGSWDRLKRQGSCRVFVATVMEAIQIRALSGTPSPNLREIAFQLADESTINNEMATWLTTTVFNQSIRDWLGGELPKISTTASERNKELGTDLDIGQALLQAINLEISLPRLNRLLPEIEIYSPIAFDSIKATSNRIALLVQSIRQLAHKRDVESFGIIGALSELDFDIHEVSVDGAIAGEQVRILCPGIIANSLGRRRVLVRALVERPN